MQNNFQVSVHHGPSFLLVVATGRAMVCDLLGALALVGAVTKEHGDDRAMLDLLAVDVALNETEHRTVGERAAHELRHLDRVASAVPQLHRLGVGETAAQGAGLNIRTFVALNEAIAWLTEKADPGS